MLLDLIGTVALTAVIVVNVVAVLGAMRLPVSGRLTLAVIVGLWIGLQAALSSAGVYAQEVPYIGIGVVLPLVAAAIAVARAPAFREALLSVPAPLLVGLNVSRVFGALFLLLAASGRLGGPFPQSAGWGDIVTGVLALPLAFAVARGSTRYLAAWNAFGALDLVAAITLGVISASGSPLQLIDAGVGSGAVAQLPWALIPTVLVPFYLIAHGVLFLQRRESPSGRHRVANAA